MDNKRSLADFDIELEELSDEVLIIAKGITGKRKISIEREFESPLDYVGIYYYFRFVEQLENSEIAEKLGMHAENVHHNLYGLGWHYSKIYDENKLMFEEEKTKLEKLLNNAREKARKLLPKDHPKLKKALEYSKSVNKNAYTSIGFNNFDECVYVLYYLFYIEKLTTVQMSILFGIPRSTVIYKLKSIGLNLTSEEGIKRKTESGRQNYEKSMRSSKISRAKDQIRNNSSGSKNENYARTLFSCYLYEHFSSEIYDIVVGVNTTGLLNSREVDIPIFIYDRNNPKLFKFVIEYNGERDHTPEKDESKKKIAAEREWIYIPLIEKNNCRFSNNPKLIEKAVRELCTYMKNIVLAERN